MFLRSRKCTRIFCVTLFINVLSMLVHVCMFVNAFTLVRACIYICLCAFVYVGEHIFVYMC